MTNLVLAILLMQIVTGLPFWEYSDRWDRVLIGVALIIVFWCLAEVIDEFCTNVRRKRWLKKRRAEKIRLEVIDLTKGKVG